MRRFSMLAALVLGLFVLVHAAVAQDATPATGNGIGQPPAGVSYEPLGYAALTGLPPDGDIALFRLTLAPGAVEPIDPNDPSLGIIYVEAGTITVTLDAPITVLRAAGAGTPFPTETEQYAAGATFTASQGDSFVGPTNVGGEARNDGDTDAVLLLAIVSPREGEAAATPAATAAP